MYLTLVLYIGDRSDEVNMGVGSVQGAIVVSCPQSC
jgi:hypothetical protein